MPTMVDVKCANKSCGTVFPARAADVKRGWGRFCSKSCKAVEQEKRTHQHANHQKRSAYEREFGGVAQFDRRGEYIGFCAQFSNEEHDCNKD